MNKIIAVSCLFLSSTLFTFVGNAEVVSNPINVGDIKTTGSDKSDWDGLTFFSDDANDVVLSNSERINWKNATMADDDNSLFLYYENFGRINPDRQNGTNLSLEWGWQVFLDTDNASQTGFQLSNEVGADYIIEGNVLMKYQGTGTDWNWSVVSKLNYNYYNKQAEFKISRQFIDNPKIIKVVFQGTNESFGGSSIDVYPDGAFNLDDELRYFSYELKDSDISDINTPPVLLDREFIIEHNSGELRRDVKAIDGQNDFLTYEVIKPVEHGSISFKYFGDAYVFFYTPDISFIGKDSFTYIASDGLSESNVATITFDITNGNNNSLSNLVDDSLISIDGNHFEWQTIAEAFDINTVGELSTGIHWEKAYMAHSETNLYLSYVNRSNIATDHNRGDSLPWGYQTFLDTDNLSSTGFKSNILNIGADYLVEGSFLYRYNGDGESWEWQEISRLESGYFLDRATIKIDRNLINFRSSDISIQFIGNNNAYEGANTDYYPSYGYFEYSLGSLELVREINISTAQQGVGTSPSSHQPSSNSNTEESNAGESGGMFHPMYILLLISLFGLRVGLRRKIN